MVLWTYLRSCYNVESWCLASRILVLYPYFAYIYLIFQNPNKILLGENISLLKSSNSASIAGFLASLPFLRDQVAINQSQLDMYRRLEGWHRKNGTQVQKCRGWKLSTYIIIMTYFEYLTIGITFSLLRMLSSFHTI